MRPRKYPVVLSDEEKSQLENVMKCGKPSNVGLFGQTPLCLHEDTRSRVVV